MRPVLSHVLRSPFDPSISGLEGAVRYLLTEKYASAPAAWYDVSDMSTLFQDSAGTVPVTAVEQPFGLQLDKSGRGWHRSQATSAKRAKLSRRYNQLMGTSTLATQSVTVYAGSYTLAFSGAGSVALTGAATGTITAGSTAITCTAGTLTLTVTGMVTDASLLIAADASLPYQRVTSASDYDADPAKFPAYLDPDGVDDAYVTATQTGWDTTSAVSVFAALQRFDNTNLGIAMVLGNTDGTGPASSTWSLVSPLSSPATSSGLFSSGDANVARVTVVTTGVAYKNVLSARANILPPNVQSWLGNTAGSLNSLSQGAGTYINNPINWFARDQSSFYFKGRAFGEIVIGAQMLDAEVALVKKYLASKAGVTL